MKRNRQINSNNIHSSGRRKFLKTTAAGLVAGSAGPFIRNADASVLRLNWLGWDPYDIQSLSQEFERQYDVKVVAHYFLGNAEAYSKLKMDDASEFHIVMADGLWPRLYAKEGLVQPINYKKLTNIKYLFKEFTPSALDLLKEENSGRTIAAPNCWGGYGLTVNVDTIDKADSDSLSMLFNEKYKGHLSTSSRFEENIALTGILVAHSMGTINAPRPDGKSFNPYVLTEQELAECNRLLIKQKGLIAKRWEDKAELEKLMREKIVWASPEWSSAYRRIYFDRLEGKTNLNIKHILQPKEGGLGWVDSWAITSGVTNSELLEIAHKWIDFRLERDNMATIATEVGCAPTVDVRDLIPASHIETLFLNQTSAIQNLYQFDAPSDLEKWKNMWADIESA